jgi:hypothetical protein
MKLLPRFLDEFLSGSIHLLFLAVSEFGVYRIEDQRIAPTVVEQFILKLARLLH